MTDKRISDLTELSSPTSIDLLAIVNSNETKKITVLSLLGSSIASIVPYTEIDDTDSPYSILTTDVQLLVDTSGGDVTVNLLAAASNDRVNLWIKNIGSGTVTVDGNVGETIDDDTTKELDQYSTIHIMCNSIGWFIL